MSGLRDVMVAALNILIALTMVAMEKTRNIAVQPAQVRCIFLLQGFLISVIGTALGLILGYVAS